MGLGSDGCEAISESVVFLRYFEDLPDPRQRAKVMYPLPEVLLLCLLAVVAGAETVTDIARFGDAKLALLRRFRPFAEGTPAHDHLGDILAALDAEGFQRCFAAWAASLAGVPEGVVAGIWCCRTAAVTSNTIFWRARRAGRFRRCCAGSASSESGIRI
jgi:hypothetical protein